MARKDMDQLKLEKIGPIFHVFRLCLQKSLKYVMVSAPWWNLFDIFFITLLEHFVSVKALRNNLSNSDQQQFSPNDIHTLSRDTVVTIYKMITKEKMPWSFIKFSQLILKGNVWRSAWRICLLILGFKRIKVRDMMIMYILYFSWRFSDPSSVRKMDITVDYIKYYVQPKRVMLHHQYKKQSQANN